MDTDKNRDLLPPAVDATFIRPIELSCSSNSEALQALGKFYNNRAYEVEDHGVIYVMTYEAPSENQNFNLFCHLFVNGEPVLCLTEGRLAINVNFDPSIQFELAYNYMRKFATVVQ